MSGHPPPPSPGHDSPQGPRKKQGKSSSSEASAGATLSSRVAAEETSTGSSGASLTSREDSTITNETPSGTTPSSREAASTLQSGELHRQTSSNPSKPPSASSIRREEKRKERVDRHKRIMAALWPHPESKKDFRDATGHDPDLDKIESSSRFRDLWMKFSASAHPSSKDRSELKRMAVDIMGKGRKLSHRTTPSSKSEVNDNTSNKRKNRSLSLERGPSSSSTPVVTPSSKIPRVGGTPQDVCPPPGFSDVIEDEASEPALDSLDMADLDGALPTMAEITKKGSKMDYPFILFIHQGKEDRRTMTKETWRCLYEQVQERCLNLIIEGKDAPTVEWSGYKAGVGFIAPKDKESRSLLKDIVDSLKVAEFNFRAWAKGEHGKYIPLSIRIPATMKQETFPSGKIMQAAILFNKLPEGKHVIYSCNPVSNTGKDRLLRIGVEEELFNAIKEKDGSLYVAASKLEVHFRKTKLTKSTVI